MRTFCRVGIWSGITLIAAVAVASGAFAGPLEETNKAVVLDFYDKAFTKLDPEAAATHFGDRYIQHNPNVPDGAAAFKAFIEMRKQRFPVARNEIKRVVAEGELVMLHVHSRREPTERGTAIVDIFRVENGKIVEHWDVVQPISETAANTNTMF